MKKSYILSAVSLSFLGLLEDLKEVAHPDQIPHDFLHAKHPDYKNWIAPAAGRRMAFGVKMGIVAARQAMLAAEVSEIGAILTGSGLGCIEDTEKFLNTILDTNEQHSTPTSFIQSTHNTVGGQIALEFSSHAYNTTYVHGGASFEAALFDAQLVLQEGEANTVLVGGVDELGKEFSKLLRLWERKQPGPIAVPFGEGAHFFVLSSEENRNAMASVLGSKIQHRLAPEETGQQLIEFLEEHAISVTAIDVLITGTNGDAFDVYYEHLQQNYFSSIPQLAYKHLVGEHYTASGFACWLGAQVLKTQEVPELFLQNKIEKQEVRYVLLYNQWKGKDHSFVLLERCQNT